jgi:hypothetical protein
VVDRMRISSASAEESGRKYPYWPGLVKAAAIDPSRMTIPLLYVKSQDTSEDQSRLKDANSTAAGLSVLNHWTRGDLISVQMLQMIHAEFGAMVLRNQNFWDHEFDRLRSGDYTRADGSTAEGRRVGAEEGRGSGLIGPIRTMREIADSLQVFGKNGGDDETRTRDLCRDRAPFYGLPTTYNDAGTAKIPVRRTRIHELWVGLWVGKMPLPLTT